MSSPTEAQIEKVKNNLTNMIAWNQQSSGHQAHDTHLSTSR